MLVSPEATSICTAVPTPVGQLLMFLLRQERATLASFSEMSCALWPKGIKMAIDFTKILLCVHILLIILHFCAKRDRQNGAVNTRKNAYPLHEQLRVSCAACLLALWDRD